MSIIVHETTPVSLIGGAPISEHVLRMVKSHAPLGVAADSGAHAMLDIGWSPEVVIGDLDSVDISRLSGIARERVHKIEEQDSTDFEKCLMRVEAPLILAAGFRGARLDHDLAGLHAMLSCPEKRLLSLSATDFVFLCPEHLVLDLPVGVRFSLFPMAPVDVGMQGLRWSFEHLHMAPGVQIGTSNEVVERVEIETSCAGLLCILPIEELGGVITQLVEQPD